FGEMADPFGHPAIQLGGIERIAQGPGRGQQARPVAGPERDATLFQAHGFDQAGGDAPDLGGGCRWVRAAAAQSGFRMRAFHRRSSPSSAACESYTMAPPTPNPACSSPSLLV